MNNRDLTTTFLLAAVGTQKPQKICKACGKLHAHNNSYCSAECCRKEKEEIGFLRLIWPDFRKSPQGRSKKRDRKNRGKKRG